MEFELNNLEAEDAGGVERIRQLFINRLNIPHQEIDETKNIYSSFESKYASTQQYTTYLKSAGLIVTNTKKESKKREEFEYELVLLI